MLRFLRSAMTALTAPPRVPIPANGVDYRGKVVLAPMVRSGELPSRLLALKYGADLVWGPETIDRSLIGAVRRVNPRTGNIEFKRFPSNGGRDTKPDRESTIYRIDPVREKGKLIFQIGTASPEYAVAAAKTVAGDIAGIDVNSGCPKPFSTSGGMGAALLRTPDRLCSILEALVKEVGNPFQIGISVKIRILETPEQTEALVSRLVKTGITGLTVHCRTTPMRPRERAIRDQLRMIASVCRNAGVACVVNGDVTSRDEALALMKEYNVDGAMIATAAEANPSCFRSEAEGGLLPWRDVAHAYVQACIEVENRFGNTKYLLNILVPGKNKDLQHSRSSKSHFDWCHSLKFDDLVPAAIRVDEVMGLSGKSIFKGPEDSRNKAFQNTLDDNESAQAAGGPARTNSIPSLVSPTPEHGIDVSISPTAQKHEVAA